MTVTETLGVIAQMPRWDGQMMWGWGWMWVVGALSMLLVVALILGIVWAATHSNRTTQPDPTSRAREILNERYARGEISSDEYRERLDALR